MIEKKIFYSWQSDLNHEYNWKFIEKCILNSIESINKKDKHKKLSLDQATRGLPGSPDIVDSIFSKIAKSSIFIADITPITMLGEKGIPNPNVLIELGYAINTLGWDNIICINNKSFGNIEQLPFDIKQRRITTYSLDKSKDILKTTERLTSIFDIAISAIQENQAEYDSVTEIFKLKIDHILLSIINHFNLVFNIKDSVIGVDVFYDVIETLHSGFDEGIEMKACETDVFLTEKIQELNELTKHPLLIINKKISQITSVMKLVEALQLLRDNILDGRFYERSIQMEKSKVNDSYVLNLLLSDIAKSIDEVLENWGGFLLTNPAFL